MVCGNLDRDIESEFSPFNRIFSFVQFIESRGYVSLFRVHTFLYWLGFSQFVVLVRPALLASRGLRIFGKNFRIGWLNS